MPSPTPTEDLLDLRMLPSWANEPARPNDYANFEGEEAARTGRCRSADSRKLRVRQFAGRFLHRRSYADGPTERQFLECRPMPAERDFARTDEPSRVSTAVAQSIRDPVQPADEFRRLPAPDR